MSAQVARPQHTHCRCLSVNRSFLRKKENMVGMRLRVKHDEQPARAANSAAGGCNCGSRQLAAIQLPREGLRRRGTYQHTMSRPRRGLDHGMDGIASCAGRDTARGSSHALGEARESCNATARRGAMESKRGFCPQPGIHGVIHGLCTWQHALFVASTRQALHQVMLRREISAAHSTTCLRGYVRMCARVRHHIIGIAAGTCSCGFYVLYTTFRAHSPPPPVR